MSSVCHEFLVEKLEVKPQKHPIKKKKKSGGGRGRGTGGDGDRTRHEKKKEKKRKKREIQETYEMHGQLRSSDLQWSERVSA